MNELLQYLISDEADKDIHGAITLDMQTGERVIDEEKLKELAKTKPFTSKYFPSIYPNGVNLDASMSYPDIFDVLDSSRLFHPSSNTILSSYIDSLVYNHRTPIILKLVHSIENNAILINKESPLITDMVYLNITDEYMTARFSEILRLEMKRVYDDRNWLQMYNIQHIFDLPQFKFSPFVFILCVEHIEHASLAMCLEIDKDVKRWIKIDELTELSEQDTVYNNLITHKILELL